MTGPTRVLIVDDDRRMTKTLGNIIRVKGFLAEEAHSGNQALRMVCEGNYDCVLTDIKMPEMNGIQLQQEINKQFPKMPVVLMTAYAKDSRVIDGLKKGAIASLTKPLDINMLLGFLSSLRERRTIVIIDDDPKFCRTLADILQVRGYAAVEITDPSSLHEAFEANTDVVVLLDMKLDDINSHKALEVIKERYHNLPVVLVSGQREEMDSAINVALELSAHTCLYKPLQISELLKVLNDVHHKELGKLLGRTDYEP